MAITDTIDEVKDVAAPARTARRLRLLMVAVLCADLVVLCRSVLLGWEMRLAFDVWSATTTGT